MPTALPDNTHVLEFGGIRLHGRLRDLSDSRQYRVAVHEYDRRDGAQTEWMGRAPHKLKVTLLFLDAEGIRAARDLVRMCDENPTRLLVHPIFGRMRMTCLGFDNARITPNASANMYEVPVEFVESAIDGSIEAESVQGVAAKTQKVTTEGEKVTQLSQSLSSTSQTAALRAVSYASTFATSAYASATGGTYAPGVGANLQAAVGGCTDATASIRTAEGDEPAAAETVIALESLAAACIELGNAYVANAPNIIDYVVPVTMHVLDLARRFYGSDAPNRVNEILTNNAAALLFGIARAGTRLRMAEPTV